MHSSICPHSHTNAFQTHPSHVHDGHISELDHKSCNCQWSSLMTKRDRAADKGPLATCKLYCVILFTSLFNLKAPGSLKSVLKGKQRVNHASTSLKLRGLTWLYRKGWREDWREEKEDQCHNTKITLHDLCSAMDFRSTFQNIQVASELQWGAVKTIFWTRKV